MGYYEERPPRHGHRTPSELAEDELLSALYGDFCGMPETPRGYRHVEAACVPTSHVALLTWADAHPFTTTAGSHFFATSDFVSAHAGKPRTAPTPKRGSEP